MKLLLALTAVFALTHAVEYNDLRVRFTFGSEEENVNYFLKVPRTLSGSVLQGWRNTPRPEGAPFTLIMQCASGRHVCALFTTLGRMAGLQVALPVDQFRSPIQPADRLKLWTPPRTIHEPIEAFWTATQYYVTNETLADEGLFGVGLDVLRGTGVWVEDLNGNLIEIPLTETELDQTDFKRQACVPGMGMHYYYNMTETMECENFLPWFGLTSAEGELIGSGFQVFGTMPPPDGKRDWYERPPADAAALAISHRPECVHDWADRYGVISLHIFYVEEPWNLPCAAPPTP